MMPGSDDIVAQLRSAHRAMEQQAELLCRAADEISRLRTALIRRGEDLQRYRDREDIANGVLQPRMKGA